MEGTGSRAARPGERDWTQGSVTRNLLVLSWPMMVTEGLYMIGISIDMVWVGRLGEAAIAGIGVAGIYAGVQMMIMTGLSIGTRALVARYIGARDVEGANYAAQQAFVVSVAYTVVMAVLGVVFAEKVLTLMGFTPDVVAIGADYMRIMFGLGSVTVAFWNMGYSIIQASGDATTPLVITIFYRILHIPLCYALVLGEWGFPQMGSNGAAIANVISRATGMVLVLWALYVGWAVSFNPKRWLLGWAGATPGRSLPGRVLGFMAVWRVFVVGPGRLRLTMRGFRVDLAMVWRMVKIGIPASVMGMQRSLSMIVIAGLVSAFGRTAVAAHSVQQRVEMVLMPVNLGLGLSSGVLAGQNLGADQPGRAERSSWQAAALSAGLMIICSAAVFFWAENIVRIFNSEPDLVATTSTFLRIAAAGYIFLGVGTVLMQSLSGAGDTVPPMVFGIIAAWAVTVPLAYFLPRVGNLDVEGVRWALVSGFVAQAILVITYFRFGRWKRKKV
ncbi:MAG: MATE family efflux transporter [Dehalococcoidales bacterium]|nr:MAG: MATE family efflux transporter [Dehalococcoidales bacterium]